MDILHEKISRGFDLLDADGDGALTEADHVIMGDRAADQLGYARGSAEHIRMVDAYVAVWRDLHAPNVGPDGRMTKREFVTSTLALAADPEAAATTVGALARAFFAIADVDGDGLVSRTEFDAFQRSHFPRIGQADLDAAFAHLDRDGNGALGPSAFESAVVEYWSSTDPSAPGNWWMGRPGAGG
ncbi:MULTISPECIES: EF-hand domain-containing protein [unclassified Streptomyces]|uniref:EF-hand domain-containing protein n=1 Tax=unclassified Streptomyces TaxID=2593676 RepID=UPI0036809EC1